MVIQEIDPDLVTGLADRRRLFCLGHTSTVAPDRLRVRADRPAKQGTFDSAPPRLDSRLWIGRDRCDEMTTKRTANRDEAPTTAVVERLVELARHAPSVHNTQPWIWRRSPTGVDLHADFARHLPAEDPSGRNLAISCGAALHHLQFAAHALGWETAVSRLPLTNDESLLARVALGRSAHPMVSPEAVEVLRQRCTDRRRFTAWPMPTERLQALCRITEEWRTHAVAITDAAAKFRLEVVVNRAVTEGELDGRRLREQDSWVGRRTSDGIPLAVLPAASDPLRARSRFGPGLLEDARMAIAGGDGLIVLGSDADDVGSWLRTGEALSALWLEATRAGLSVVPMSQPIEIDSTRREIRDEVLDNSFVPHLLLRIGWQAMGRSDLPRTPRRPVSDILR
ncbi:MULTISPECIES: Acg family FMN-binding oxidoreductase [Nocardioides]|uniref:Acg family FMN-binding oxidoreductase n=1 Tax=Nocardioides vastitatis TaxID=2568655 RepID=A0ABW0ZIK9_9ACTN|nr:NAD(P)H nitroreductase [Nocardioides sp.]THJ06210.1 NAD(P)H nitroreductase [Nocardioides sp.]